MYRVTNSLAEDKSEAGLNLFLSLPMALLGGPLASCFTQRDMANCAGVSKEFNGNFAQSNRGNPGNVWKFQSLNYSGIGISLKELIKRHPKLSNEIKEGFFIQANLEGANLEGANLAGAQLQGANLYEVILRLANLQGAHLQNAYLNEAELNQANLQGAHLKGAHLERADLQWANLRGADLREANLSRADLRHTDLRLVDLRWTNLEGANLKMAILLRDQKIPRCISMLGRENWESDSSRSLCSNCRQKFTFLNRRHHCRSCGHVVCGTCSLHNEAGWGRLCNRCV